MGLQVALSDYAPRRGLQAGPPLAPSTSADDRPNRNNIAASLLLHFLVLFGIFLLPQTPPVEVVVPVVTLRFGESGAAGAAGGQAGGGGGGHGAEASSAPAEQKSAEAASEPREATPTSPEPTPPEPTPPDPTPPTPTPPTPEASPLPPAPQALAPKPKPHPRPVVKQHAVRPTPPVPVKPVETPTPPVAPTVATQPPPGPANGQGPPTQNPQPGTAATGTASAGPGGAAGVGTGAAGAGRGAFGNGKGSGDDYLDRLYRHLLKYKRTPPDAIARRQEGTVHVSMVIARNGTVLDATISTSSGFPLLDRAILDMVHSASPVPPLPPEVPGDTAKVGLRFTFTIGVFDRIFR
ncbi:MAG TPA: TonB family protein [Stellaceae bacterium]|jgi:protein TonB|nr:TonB family protein [Stellaceae bacterium]